MCQRFAQEVLSETPAGSGEQDREEEEAGKTGHASVISAWSGWRTVDWKSSLESQSTRGQGARLSSSLSPPSLAKSFPRWGNLKLPSRGQSLT